MNRTTSTLLSLGLSAVLIAVGVWLLCSHNIGIWPENGQRGLGHTFKIFANMGMVMVLFWTLVIAAFALLISGVINAIRGRNDSIEKDPMSREIIKRRQARGESDRVEYEDIRRNLIS